MLPLNKKHYLLKSIIFEALIILIAVNSVALTHSLTR